MDVQESAGTERKPRRRWLGPASLVAAGLVVTDLRHERPRTEFYDVGAVVYFLRLVVWIGIVDDQREPL